MPGTERIVVTAHDPQCPRRVDTMVKPNDCSYCEVIRAVRLKYGSRD